MPNTWLDVYRGVEYEQEEWYVKFCIQGERIRLNVLSASWDGRGMAR